MPTSGWRIHCTLDQQLGLSVLTRRIGWHATDKNDNFLVDLSGRVGRRWGRLVVTCIFAISGFQKPMDVVKIIAN